MEYFEVRHLFASLVLLMGGTRLSNAGCKLLNYEPYDIRQPSISFTASPYPYVVKDSKVTLSCAGYANNPNPLDPNRSYMTAVEFERSGQHLKECREKEEKHLKYIPCEITVTNISPSDTFACTVHATYSPCNDSVLRFNVSDPVAPERITINWHSSDHFNLFQFRCNVIGYPEPTLHWLLNDSVIGNRIVNGLTILKRPVSFLPNNKTLLASTDIGFAATSLPSTVQCFTNSSNNTFSHRIHTGYIRINVTKRTRKTATLQWLNGFELNTNLSYVSGYTFALVNLNTSNQTLTTQTNTSELILYNLSSNTSYLVKLSRLISTGDLVIGAVTFTTLDRLPEPRHITVVNRTSTAAFVQWDRIPQNPKIYGDILGYRVGLHINGRTPLLFKVPQNQSHRALEKLHPNSTYGVTVQASGKHGDGFVSEKHFFKTLRQLPNPSSVKVVNVTSTTATVQWQMIPPEEGLYGAVLGYQVIVSTQGKPAAYFPTAGNKYEMVLDGLNVSTTYNVCVRGLAAGGAGKNSEKLNFTTLGLTLNDPKQLPRQEDTFSSAATIGLVTGGILCAFLVALTFYLVRRRKRNQKPQMRNSNNPFHVNLRILYPEHHIEGDSNWEIPRARLVVLDKTLGGGYFGVVKEGIYIRSFEDDNNEDDTVPVAVKTLRGGNSAEDWEELRKELDILEYVNAVRHPHIVNLLGGCTVTAPILIVMEYCEGGTLRDLLIGSRGHGGVLPDYQNIYSSLTERQLINFAAEIADGMEFLYQKKVVHRDIATRNILLDGKLRTKIADFGLARKVDLNPLYIVNKNKVLPAKWMALESLQDGIFTLASDKWSYGVLLWEICSLAGEPYREISPFEILAYLREGNRMCRPQYCSSEIFSLMERCWDSSPERRPNFQEIGSSLQKMLADHERVYVNVKTVDNPSAADEVGYTSAENSSQGNKESSKDNCLEVPETGSSGNDSGIFDTSC